MGKVLSAGSVESYRRDGFLPPIRIFPPAEAQKLRDHFEAFEAEHGKVFSESRATVGMAFTGSYRFKSHLLMKWLANVIRQPKILDAVEDLIGPDLLCWTTHWFVKEASSPQYVSWHQESNYWGLDTTELVSVWLALSPSTIESGCMRVLPGSHLEPPMEHVDTYAEDNMLTRGQEIHGIDESKAVNLEVQPGEVLLFDYRLAHASYPNRTNDRRIGVGIRYVPPATRQVRHDWDSATLVRGEDAYGHFELEPGPRCDFDPPAVEMHRRADDAQRKVYYEGAAAVPGEASRAR